MFKQQTQRISIVVAVLGLLVSAVTVAAAPAQRSTGPVYWFPGTPLAGQVVPDASSRLVRTASGVSMNLKTALLPAGSAQTVWWVVFNYPEHCIIAYHCGEPDLFMSPDVAPSVMFAAGHVIGATGKGNFGGHLSVGDTSGCHIGPIFSDPALADLEFPCNPLVNPDGAEIHLAVHDHGLAVQGMIHEQISSFDGGCANLGAGAGPNMCATIQASTHPAP